MIHKIRIASRGHEDPRGEEVLRDIRRLNLGNFSDVKTVKVYRFEGLAEADAEMFASRLADVDEFYMVNEPIRNGATTVVEVAYRPGIMNPESASLMKMGSDLGFRTLLAADSSMEYHFFGDIENKNVVVVVDRLLMNAAVQHVVTEEPKTLIITATTPPAAIVPIRDLDDEALRALSKDTLFLTLDEMRTIQGHFRDVLRRDPRDIELETPGVMWSEHCCHKTFNAEIMRNGQRKTPFMTRLKQTSARYSRGVVSAFVDNAGAGEFYEGWSLCGKVETHNKPSNIDPVGGAATGTGGVLRDDECLGEGAKVVASSETYCLASPKTPSERLPPGVLLPESVYRGVVVGVGGYGNRMGIPTVLGSTHFHDDFRANAVVIVGSFGILPTARAKKGVPQPGDLIIVAGGRTGRDGIHGATFSSGETTDRTSLVNSGAVQIGNAIEEKRLFDANLVIRDKNCIRAKTDCGAGGLCCAVSELGSQTGVRVDLKKVPVKYAGLSPSEIWISESQERDVIIIRPEDLPTVLETYKLYNVEAAVIGVITNDHQLVVSYGDEIVCDLSMEFVHHGLPRRVMKAELKNESFPEPQIPLYREEDFVASFEAVVGHLNVASREPVARLYDQSVQGTSALAPFTGVFNDCPNDAVVLRPLLGKPYGLVLSQGLNPILNRIDPYWGSLWAGVKAMSNYVAAGGRIAQGEAFLIDNFIWPFPDEESLAALDEAVDACVKLMHVFKLPFISGKDSLSSTYRGHGMVIKIPPVLCVSMFGRIPNVMKTVSADFKRSDSHLLLLGRQRIGALGGSVYYDTLGYVGNRLPKPDLENAPRVFDTMHRWVNEGKILAAKSIGEGGLAAALAKMCFGGDVGAEIGVSSHLHADPRHAFFNETSGCLLLEVKGEHLGMVQELPGLVRVIGKTSPRRAIIGRQNLSESAPTLFSIETDRLRCIWKQPMLEVFGHAKEAA